MAVSSVPARTWWHECKSAGGSCCQPLSGVERRCAAPLSSPQPENQHSYSLLLFVQTSASSLSLHAVFFFLVFALVFFHFLLSCLFLTHVYPCQRLGFLTLSFSHSNLNHHITIRLSFQCLKHVYQLDNLKGVYFFLAIRCGGFPHLNMEWEILHWSLTVHLQCY